jgi:hypothetical protein
MEASIKPILLSVEICISRLIESIQDDVKWRNKWLRYFWTEPAGGIVADCALDDTNQTFERL